MIRITPQAIPDVLLIEPDRFGDERGFFAETYRMSALAEAGFSKPFIQDNQALSGAKNTLRGLHFQTGADVQAKLVRATRGAVLDVVVDLRRGSPWYGQSVAIELSAANFRQVLVPEGFAHGYLTLTEESEVLYKVTAYYAPASETGILWSDPALNIDWPAAPGEVLVNARDQAWPLLADFVSPFVYEVAS